MSAPVMLPARLRTAALVAASVFLTGCSAITDDVCTQAGCMSGLAVQLSTPPTTAYRVEAFVPGSSRASYVVECADPSRCEAAAFFPDFLPERVTVRVVAGGRTSTQEFTPTYAETRPNGPDCPPRCRFATVTFPAAG